MNNINDLAQVYNTAKYGKNLIMCIDCTRFSKGKCERTGYKVRPTESCVQGKERGTE